MIDTAQLEKLTEDCKQISEAIGIMSLDRGTIGIYLCGCPIKCSPDNKTYMDDLPFADKLTGIANEVRDLIKRRLTEAMQDKANQIRNLCQPDPPTMKDVHAVMIQTDANTVAELAELLPPSVTGFHPGEIQDVSSSMQYIPGPAKPVCPRVQPRSSPSSPSAGHYASDCDCELLSENPGHFVRFHIDQAGNLAIITLGSHQVVLAGELRTLRYWLNGQKLEGE